MSKIKLTETCNITTGKLDANAAEKMGKYPYFTCAPEPLFINTFAFDDDVIILAGNNASGNFHCQRYRGKFNAYQRTYVITAKQGYDIEYIYYNLKINLQYLKRIAQGSQTKFLTMQILDGFQVEDIPIHEQKKTTEILAYVDNRIENNNKINAELESMVKTIYDYWFLQYEFPNEEGKPYKSSGGEMVWNEELRREIPRGWRKSSFSELVEIGNGKDHKELHDGNIPVYGSGGVMRTVDTFIYKGESVLIPRKGTLNNIIYVNGAFWTVDTMFYTKMKKAHSAIFTYYSVKLYDFEKLNTGTGVPSMTSSIIYNLKTVIPSDKILKNFDNYVQVFYKKMQEKEIENRELESLRDFLLPLLMNGQVGFKD